MKRRPASRVRGSLVVGWLGLALVIGGAGGYLLVRPPALTPLVNGRVTPSLFENGRQTAPPSVPTDLGPPRGMLPGRRSAPTAAMPRVPPASRGLASTTTSGPPQFKTVAVVDLNSAELDQLQTLPGITAAYAKRIVAGRPYHVFSDVVTRAGIPASIVDQLSPPAIIRSIEPAPSAPKPGALSIGGREPQ